MYIYIYTYTNIGTGSFFHIILDISRYRPWGFQAYVSSRRHGYIFIYTHPNIGTGSLMHMYMLFQICLGIGPRGSRYMFLQGGINVHILHTSVQRQNLSCMFTYYDISTGRRGSKHPFLQGGMDLHIYIYTYMYVWMDGCNVM